MNKVPLSLFAMSYQMGFKPFSQELAVFYLSTILCAQSAFTRSVIYINLSSTNSLDSTAFYRQNGEFQKQFHWIWTAAIRTSLHNGVAMYATWVSIATLLNLGM